MKYRTRICYTEEQKALMWDRWQRGESLNSIARLFDRGHSSIQGILAESGGIRPAQRRRSCRSLTSLQQFNHQFTTTLIKNVTSTVETILSKTAKPRLPSGVGFMLVRIRLWCDFLGRVRISLTMPSRLLTRSN